MEVELEAPATISFQLEPTGASPPDGSGGKAFSIVVPSLDSGVDLGAVCRALRVEPSTARLNGHLISSGASGVSSVTWKSLLAFFSSRGFPTGVCSDGGLPIRVRGKSLATGSLHGKKRGSFCFRRDSSTGDDETPPQKRKYIHCTPTHLQNVSDPAVDENILLCLKRKLTLDDDTPLNKRRSSKAISLEFKIDTNNRPLLTSKSTLSSGLTGGFIGGCRKRGRENDMFFSIPCTQTE